VTYRGWNDRTPEQRQEMGIEVYQGYGREDAIFAGYPGRVSCASFDAYTEHYCTTPEKLLIAYEQARQETEQEKQKNPSLFYLRELLRRMDADGEWYGNAFLEPMWLVQRVIRALEQEEALIDAHIQRYRSILVDKRADLLRAHGLSYDATPIIDVLQYQIKVLEIRIDTLKELTLSLQEGAIF
jgi:hypothetical protein